MNTATKQPFSRIDRSDNNVKPYSFQLSFTSSDGSFSFKTSIFTSSYMVSNWNFIIYSHFSNKTAVDNLVSVAFAILSILPSCFSWYSSDSDEKVNSNEFIFNSQKGYSWQFTSILRICFISHLMGLCAKRIFWALLFYIAYSSRFILLETPLLDF